MGLKSVSMVCVKGKLLVRHSKCTDKPFVVYDCQTLQEAATFDQVTFKSDVPVSADNIIYDSLAFKTTPFYDLSIGAVSQTQERHMTASPMTFDGRYLYAISTVRNKDTPKKV